MHERVEAVGDHTTLADRKRRAGQRMILGFEGPSVTDDLRSLVAEIRPAGFILFARNVEEPAQVRELNRELASLCDSTAPALLSVDQEGGRVQRVRAPATVWPSMRALARSEVDPAQAARGLALELRAMGFNLNYAPVADVDSNPKNPVIGDRSFGRSPAEVSRYVVAFLRAQQEVGVVACAKHFPGHGDTDLDSHLALPAVEREEPHIRETELPPFRAAVAAGVGTIMTAHVVFPAFDEEWPATLSERVIPRLLRAEMGYDGVVISDDLEMKAVHGRWPVDELVRRATGASVDVMLCCRSHALQHEVFSELVRAQEQDPAMHRATETSELRVHALRQRFLLNAPPQPDLAVVGCPAHRDLAARIAERGAA